MGFSFEVVFVENSTCMSHEQCTRPTTKCGMELKSAFQHYPNIHLGLFGYRILLKTENTVVK